MINFLSKYRFIGIKYFFTRARAFIPMFLLAKKFKKSGSNFFIEKPYRILNPHYIEVGYRFRVFFGGRIECIDRHGGQKFFPKIRIGNYVTIGNYTHIGVINELIIEDNVLLGSKVYITDHNHGDYQNEHSSPLIPPRQRDILSKGKVILKENCWLGEGVCVLSNVTIGTGSIIGANSVVTKNIPDYCIAVGIPARVIKKFDFESNKWTKI